MCNGLKVKGKGGGRERREVGGKGGRWEGKEEGGRERREGSERKEKGGR